MSGRFLLLIVTVALMGVAVLLPVLSMIREALVSNGTVDLSLYHKLWQSGAFTSLRNSLLLAASVATASTVAGVGLGIVLGKVKLPLRTLFLVLLTLPLLIPPYILALGWFDLLGREGYWGSLLFGFWGTFWVLFCLYLPIPLLLTILFLRQIDPRLEEAGRIVTSWPGVLRYITLPLIFPAIVLSFLLVFILAFGEQSVANFLRYDVFALESFTYFSAFYDFRTATALAVPMVGVALIVLVAEQILVHKRIFHFTALHEVERIDVHRYQPLLIALLLSFVTVVTLLPFLALLYQSAEWQVLHDAFVKAQAPMLRSYLYGTIAATLLMVLGFVSGYLIAEHLPGARGYDASLIFLFTLPSTVIGIALILFWNRPATNFIYTTPLIILFGYVGKYLAVTTKISQTGLSQISRSQIEAAQIAGANGWQVFRYILVPLSAKVLFVVWMIGLIFSLRETTLTMLVYPPGHETLPVYTMTQMANGDPKIIAALCLFMTAMVLLPLGIWGMARKVRHG